ncbi:hypothetical protein RUM43_013298 [Polyplax serrata]|uniref:BTB domain-containing protein n=1 Tax=Polyplax serrata TaxID=468196 RepID=A0AAN8Q2L4_POLSC
MHGEVKQRKVYLLDGVEEPQGCLATHQLIKHRKRAAFMLCAVGILPKSCKSFQNAKRGEVCRIPIPGCTVAPPSTPGGPAPIRLPHVQGDTFKKFIHYVYTGKIMLQDSAVFEMLSLAQDLGVEELRTTCEDYVTSTLSPLNACTFLAAAMDIQERTAGKYNQL